MDREKNKFIYKGKEYPATQRNLEAYRLQEPKILSEIVLDFN